MSEMKHGATADRNHLEGMGTREETIALWSEASGICADDIEWYEDFMALKIACLGISMARLWGTELPEQSRLAKRLNLGSSG